MGQRTGQWHDAGATLPPIERQEFIVAFRGELTAEGENALRRAGYGVHRDGIGTGAAWYGSTDPGVTLESKHVVTHVVAENREESETPRH